MGTYCNPGPLRLTLPPDVLARLDEDSLRQEARERELRKLDRYRRSGTPERYWSESLDTFDTASETQALAKAAVAGFVGDVLDGRFVTLVLLGTPGTGKTHLACAAVRECGGKYRTSQDMAEEMRRARAFGSEESEKRMTERYERCRLLAIDEIGRGISAPEEKYMLYQMINARYNVRGPSVLVSNLAKPDFIRYIGAAAADRLAESGKIVEMGGESYRMRIRRGNLRRV